MESCKKDEDEFSKLNIKLHDTELKLKYSENNLEKMKTDSVLNQKHINELEFKVDSLKHQLEIKVKKLKKLYLINLI